MVLNRFCSIAAVLLLCFTPSAFASSVASSVSMELTSVGSNIMGNNPQVYVGPYTATIVSATGTTTGVQVICDDYADDSYLNTWWSANLVPLTSVGPGTKGTLSTDSVKYQEAAYLVDQMLSSTYKGNSTTVGEIHYALWQLFDPGPPFLNLTPSQLAGAQWWLTNAQNYFGSVTNLASFSIYTPTGQAPHPQEFLSVTGPVAAALPVPEPTAAMLLAVDLLALALVGIVLRRRGCVTAN